jgi:hypothetical protein
MWSHSSQNSRVFGWTSILAAWNQGSNPQEVSTLLDNLSRDHCPPVGHFFTYLNEEQDGLKWFIYECVASSWMWNTGPRLLFIRETLDLIENLESTFPPFPGSPCGTQTVRQFLTENLSNDQLAYINMMPTLVHFGASAASAGIAAFAGAAAASAPPTAARVALHRGQRNGHIRFHVIRDVASNGKTDDVITIHKVGEDRYSYTYKDATSMSKKKECVHPNLSGSDVISMLRNLFNLLLLDVEPFQRLQVMLPTTPSILLKMSSLDSTTRDHLYDSVETVMKNWPVYA